MKDAIANIQCFCASHGIDVFEGTIPSVFQANERVGLGRRIADLAPSHLHVFPYDGVQLDLVPLPCLIVHSNGKLAIVQKASQNWVILSGAGYSSRQRIKKLDFELRFKPSEVIAYTGFETSEFTWRTYLRGFSRTNSGRLFSGFLGSLMGSLASLAMPIGALLIIDKVLGHNGVGTLDTVIIVVILAELLRFFVTVSKNIILGEVAEEFIEETRSLLFNIYRSSFKMQSPPTSHVLYNTLSHVEKTRKIYTDYSVTLAAEMLFLFVLVALMFSLSPLLAKVTLIGVVVSIFATMAVSRLRSVAKTKKFDVTETNNKLFVGLLMSAGDRRVMGKDHNSGQQWNENVDAMIQFDLASSEYKYDSSPVNNLILNVLRAAVMWFGAIEVLNGLMTLGQFVAFNLIVALSLGPVKSAANFVSNWTMLNRSAIALQSMLRRRVEQAQNRTFRLPDSELLTTLEFRNVSLLGKKDAPPIATGINLEIKKGDKIAILGESGSGKSTLINAILGMSQLSDGSILLNGIKLQEYSMPAYRRKLGVLAQTASLSHGTVLENLVCGEPQVNMDLVKAATQQADIHEVIAALDRGYDEQISNETRKLSQGQKQRLLLARALLNGQHMLLLDEPTSALDEAAEKTVGQNLVDDEQKRTFIVATHSLNLASMFDRVLLFKDKKLVEVSKTSTETLLLRRNLDSSLGTTPTLVGRK